MGRYISDLHKRCIREEDSESNNRVIDKVLVQKCLPSFSLLMRYFYCHWFINRSPIINWYVWHVFSKKK